MATRTITLSASGWTQTVSRLYYDDVAAKFYTDTALTQEVTSIPIPTRELYRFDGFWNSSSTTATSQWIYSDGSFNADWHPTASATIYVHQTQVSYKVTLDGSGGTPNVVFYAKKLDATRNEFYSDYLCANLITSLQQLPTRTGYVFKGGYSTASSSVQYVTNEGVLTETFYALSITAAKTIYSQWTAKTFVLTFDYNGGSGQTESKSVTFGHAIGTLPTATRQRASFSAWQIDGSNITASTVWNLDSNKTASAKWDMFFGSVTDYFNLGNANLIPESSDSGDNKQHVCAYNATSESPATETSIAWRNPSVTYRVVGDMMLSVSLGGAFSGSVTTGYMITSVEVSTAIGEAPIVTVSAVANEGANAVKTYSISIPVSARHRPQNLLGAIYSTTNGGDLRQLTLTATCDPVVVAENNVPCASDVCHGRIEVSAITHAYDNEAEPQAGNGFVQVGAPLSRSGTGYKTWSVNLRKELT